MFDNIEKRESSEVKNSNNTVKPGNVPPKENFSLNNQVDLAKVNTLPSPVPEGQGKEFEQRMQDLHTKGKKRGFLYSLIGLIGGIIITIGAMYLVNSFKGDVQDMSNEINRQDKEPIEAIIDPENICENDYCCLASLRRIKNNNHTRIGVEDSCPAGQVMNSLECINSLYWCEPGIDLVNTTPATVASTSEIIATTSSALIASSTSGLALPDVLKEESSPEDEIAEENLDDNEDPDNIIDSDQDGLSDLEEREYGTEIDNPDSDGDGFLDGDEVKSGFNPLGEGKL
jgi:hypothetical protein